MRIFFFIPMQIQEEAELTLKDAICKASLVSSKYFRNSILKISCLPPSSLLYSYSLPEKKNEILSAVSEIFLVAHLVLQPNSKLRKLKLSF